RFLDELKRNHFLSLSREEAQWLRDDAPFGAEVHKQFPSTAFDALEASRCLALERYTACVMHLVRVLDVALGIIAKTLGITLDKEVWDKILEMIKARIKENAGAASSFPKRFYDEVVAQLYAVKTAWRNP